MSSKGSKCNYNSYIYNVDACCVYWYFSAVQSQYNCDVMIINKKAPQHCHVKKNKGLWYLPRKSSWSTSLSYKSNCTSWPGSAVRITCKVSKHTQPCTTSWTLCTENAKHRATDYKGQNQTEANPQTNHLRSSTSRPDDGHQTAHWFNLSCFTQNMLILSSSPSRQGFPKASVFNTISWL